MAFNFNDFLNSESKKEMKTDWKPIKVSVTRLHPAPDKANFYHADDKEVKELAESIELVGLQQYPVIRPIEGTDDYEVIAGHKRRLALLRLLAEGKTEYELVPCKVVSPDDTQNELILIFTNSTQRERTDYEKMREIERVRELLEEYQKTHELPGRKQTLIAKLLGTSKTKVGTLDNINRNLSEPFKEEFASGNISTSTANEIAGLEKEKQQELYKKYQETGTVRAKEAKTHKETGTLQESSLSLCDTCTHQGECAGKKTHEDGCLGYEEADPRAYGLAEVNKLLQEYKKGSFPPSMLQTRKIIIDALKLLQEKLENE